MNCYFCIKQRSYKLLFLLQRFYIFLKFLYMEADVSFPPVISPDDIKKYLNHTQIVR